MADQQKRNQSDEENPQIEDESIGSAQSQRERSSPEPASTADDRSDTSRRSFGSESDEELDRESDLESDDEMEEEDEGIDSGSSR